MCVHVHLCKYGYKAIIKDRTYYYLIYKQRGFRLALFRYMGSHQTKRGSPLYSYHFYSCYYKSMSLQIITSLNKVCLYTYPVSVIIYHFLPLF